MTRAKRLAAATVASLALLVLGAGAATAQDSPPVVDDRTFEREPETEVLGAQTVRQGALPSTGGGAGPEVYVGAGLTVVGLGLAMGARHRRQRLGRQGLGA